MRFTIEIEEPGDHLGHAGEVAGPRAVLEARLRGDRRQRQRRVVRGRLAGHKAIGVPPERCDAWFADPSLLDYVVVILMDRGRRRKLWLWVS